MVIADCPPRASPLESHALMPGMHDGFTLASIAADAKTQVVAVGGTIAMTEARMLESHVFAGIRAARTRVVLDLTGVAVAEPGLLGALLRIRRGVTGVGGQLALVVDGPPMSVLVATSLLARLTG